MKICKKSGDKVVSILVVSKGMYEAQYKALGYIPFTEDDEKAAQKKAKNNGKETPVKDTNPTEDEVTDETEDEESDDEEVADETEDLDSIPVSEMTHEQLKVFAKKHNVKLKGMNEDQARAALAKLQ